MIPTTEMIPAATTEMIPGISGMELRGLEKLYDNLVRAFYLFILHLFYGVQFTFYRTLFCSKLFFFFWFNTRQYLFKRCNSLMSSISSNFLKIFLQENLFNKIVLKQNKSNFAIRLCLPDDVMTTVMTSVTGSHYNTCFPITSTSCCSCHLKSLTS